MNLHVDGRREGCGRAEVDMFHLEVVPLSGANGNTKLTSNVNLG